MGSGNQHQIYNGRQKVVSGCASQIPYLKPQRECSISILMFGKHEDFKIKIIDAQGFSSPRFPFVKSIKSSEDPQNPLKFSKLPPHKKTSSQHWPQGPKKFGLNNSLPLKFSTPRSPKSKMNESGNISSRLKTIAKSVYTHRVGPASESQELRQMRIQHEKLKKEHEWVKSQYQNLLAQLRESETEFKKMNESYERKVQETQTLKSIIDSIKEHAFREYRAAEPLTPRAHYGNRLVVDPQQNYYPSNLNIDSKRSTQNIQENTRTRSNRQRVSIKDSPLLLNQIVAGLLPKALSRIQEARMRLVQSIKGSTYDIYSQILL